MIYKIVPHALWQRAEAQGIFSGASIDVADGFIHFSTGAQVEETAAKHFAGQRDLVLVAVDPTALGQALKWEVSRGGQNFPHLYAPLSLRDVCWTKILPLGSDGTHQLGCLLA